MTITTEFCLEFQPNHDRIYLEIKPITDLETKKMKRIIDYYLRQWVHSPRRKSLILNGARQVGKTHAVRALAASSFTDFAEINFESNVSARAVFDHDLDPKRILHALSLTIGKPIIPGKTLLFFDEIQAAPRGIIALRYFYEEMPELHVIAAGSLIQFAIEQVGVPVGRVEFLDMYPVSFIEFLAAMEQHAIITEILNQEPKREISPLIHTKCLHLIATYLALGGMPEVLDCWQKTKNALECIKVHHSLLKAYRQDFEKYAKKNQIPYVSLLFNATPLQLGRKFKYSDIEGEYRKRELQPALNLLETAGIIHKAHSSSGQGWPIGAHKNLQDFKVLFLDVGLAQTVLGLDLANWFLNPLTELVNKGAIVESFVGQELLAYTSPERTAELFYWHREIPSSTAEIDYLIQQKDKIIPIEVKGGHGTTLRSMHSFLSTHPQSPHGIRFSAQNYSVHEKIISYPLYAVASVATEGQEEMKKAIEAL